jgi:hypothetical protein
LSQSASEELDCIILKGDRERERERERVRGEKEHEHEHGAPPLLICRLHFWGSVKCLTGSHVGMIELPGLFILAGKILSMLLMSLSDTQSLIFKENKF